MQPREGGAIFGRERVLLERICVFLGPIGTGKTSLYGCFQGDETLQVLRLETVTRGIHAVRFVKDYVDEDGRPYSCAFNCYDTEGFSGNAERDIFILNNLISELRENLPRVHVVYYVLTAVRMSHSDRQTLKLVAEHGGDELRRRMKFIMTNAPDRTINNHPEILQETLATISELIGHQVGANDLLTTNLADPNQFEPEDPMYAATLRHWATNKERFQVIVRDIPDNEAFRINEISTVHKTRSLLSVFRVKIFAVIAILLILSFIYCGSKSYSEMQSVLEKMEELARQNAQLKSAYEQAKQAVSGDSSAGQSGNINNAGDVLLVPIRVFGSIVGRMFGGPK